MIKSNLKMYPYEIIEENNKKYLYSIITSGLYELDDVAIDILNDNYSNLDEEHSKTLEFMKDNLLMKTDDNDKTFNKLYEKASKDKMTMNPSSLVLMVTQDCNLKCKYCYGEEGSYHHKGMMSDDTAKNAIDYFLKLSKSKTKNICFFGGEPLLNFDLIKKLVAYVKELEKTNKFTTNFSMTTNATLLNEEIEDFIIDNNIIVTVSIDGDKTVQNANRYFANKKGCYEQVVKKTERLRNANLLIARATITPESTDILPNIQHLISLGFKKVSWATAQNLLSDEDFVEFARNEVKVIQEVEELIHNGKFDEAKKYTNIIKILKKLEFDIMNTKACGCGTGMIAINIEGNIYPCQRFVGTETMILGNINDPSNKLNETFYNHVCIKSFDKCQTCLSRNLCVGGCVYENFQVSGDISEPPENRCESIRELHKQIIQMYLRLSDRERAKLFGGAHH